MDRPRNEYTQAFVRPPGTSFVNAIAVNPQPIDVGLARRQHAEYVTALRAAGVAVRALEADEAFPDGCFMQDPAVILGGAAMLNRMGAPSRAGEPALLAELLRAEFPVCAMQAPGTLEGGDVLSVGDRVFVGETARTNAAGVAQLRDWLAPRGIGVEAVPLTDYLHLLTVMTYVGRNVMVVLEDVADYPFLNGFDLVRVPRAEAYAANTLGIHDSVILPAGFPETAAQLRARGFSVLPVPMSEFYKADGGVSCLALIW